MIQARRHFCLAILIALLIGHIGVAAHAASHVADESVECSLCISFSDLTHAVSTGHEPGIQNIRVTHALADLEAHHGQHPDTSYLPRGPPLTN